MFCQREEKGKVEARQIYKQPHPVHLGNQLEVCTGSFVWQSKEGDLFLFIERDKEERNSKRPLERLGDIAP